jgi:hypothetical protein
MALIPYSFTAVIWQHSPPGGWYFVTLPREISDEIRSALQSEEEGWGRMKAQAKIGATEWKTAIWYDTKHKAYLLPLKADVREKEKLRAGIEVKVEIKV